MPGTGPGRARPPGQTEKSPETGTSLGRDGDLAEHPTTDQFAIANAFWSSMMIPEPTTPI